MSGSIPNDILIGPPLHFATLEKKSLRTSDKNLEVGPSSADSANSHHFFFSRVQNAKGMAMKLLKEMYYCT